MKKQSQAFTLIELLVVIVIIGILATISTATFGDAKEKAKNAKSISYWQQVNSYMSEHVQDMYLRLDFEDGSGTSAEDSSGQQNTLTVGNSALWSTDTPHANSEYALSSRSAAGTSYTSYITNATVPRDDFTASFLLKIKNHVNFTDVIGYNWTSNEVGWVISLQADGSLLFDVGRFDSANRIQGVSLETDKWYHIAITRDTAAETMSMYLNGEHYETRTDGLASSSFNPNKSLIIGLNAFQGDDFLIDDIVFWGKPYNPE